MKLLDGANIQSMTGTNGQHIDDNSNVTLPGQGQLSLDEGTSNRYGMSNHSYHRYKGCSNGLLCFWSVLEIRSYSRFVVYCFVCF